MQFQVFHIFLAKSKILFLTNQIHKALKDRNYVLVILTGKYNIVILKVYITFRASSFGLNSFVLKKRFGQV